MPESAFEDFPGLGFPVKDITCAFVKPINLGEAPTPPRNKFIQEYVDEILNCPTMQQAEYKLGIYFTRGYIPHHIKRLVTNYLHIVTTCTDGYVPGTKLNVNKAYHKVTFFNKGKVTEIVTNDFFFFDWNGVSLDVTQVQKVIKPNWMELIKIKINEWIEQRQCDTYDLV